MLSYKSGQIYYNKQRNILYCIELNLLLLAVLEWIILNKDHSILFLIMSISPDTEDQENKVQENHWHYNRQADWVSLQTTRTATSSLKLIRQKLLTNKWYSLLVQTSLAQYILQVTVYISYKYIVVCCKSMINPIGYTYTTVVIRK